MRLGVEDRVVDFELDAVINKLLLAVPVFVGVCVAVVVEVPV